MKKLSKSKKWLFCLIAFLLGVLVLEGGAFLLYSLLNGRFFPFREFQAGRSGIRAASHLGRAIRERPAGGDKVIHPYLGFVVDPEKAPGHSDYGFPGEETVTLRPTEDELIVGIFGGSFAMDTAEWGKVAIREALKKNPKFAAKKIVFRTVAMGGYKQPQQLMALVYLLSLGAHFDIVINIDGFNEVALSTSENIAKEVSPFYPRSWERSVEGIFDQEMLLGIGALSSLADRRRGWAGVFSRSPLKFSPTLNLLWKAGDRMIEKKLAAKKFALEQYNCLRQFDGRYVTAGPPFEYEGSEELYRKLADFWRRSSAQMGRLCEANGIAYYHFLQPNQYLEGSKIMGEEELEVAFWNEHPYREGVVEGYPYLREAGRELRDRGVDFYNLTMVFREFSEPLYIDDCCHLSEKGYGMIGAEIGRLISAGDEEESPAEIPNPKSQIPNPKSQIPNPKSQIPNPKSQITNNKSQTITKFLSQRLIRLRRKIPNLPAGRAGSKHTE